MFFADDARLMVDAVYTVWMRIFVRQSVDGNRSYLSSNVISVGKGTKTNTLYGYYWIRLIIFKLIAKLINRTREILELNSRRRIEGATKQSNDRLHLTRRLFGTFGTIVCVCVLVRCAHATINSCDDKRSCQFLIFFFPIIRFWQHSVCVLHLIYF